MADTIRDLSALQTLLADNTAGDISAQDARDVLVTNYPRDAIAYGAVPTSGWSWINQGTASLTQSNGVDIITDPGTGANNIIARDRTAPATPYSMRALVGGHYLAGSGGMGVLFTGAGTGLFVMYLRYTSWLIETWSNPTTFNSSVASGSFSGGTPVWLGLEDDGTNLIFSIGSGNHADAMVPLLTTGRTLFFGAGPTGIGVAMRDNNDDIAMTLHSWTVE